MFQVNPVGQEPLAAVAISSLPSLVERMRSTGDQGYDASHGPPRMVVVGLRGARISRRFAPPSIHGRPLCNPGNVSHSTE